jgi:putative flippase GtrA
VSPPGDTRGAAEFQRDHGLAAMAAVVLRLQSRQGMRPTPLLRELFQALRAGAAGVIATAVDLLVLTVLVSGLHVDARLASLPALLCGGVANFIGNRHFAFRAQEGSLLRQIALYAVVEVFGLGYGGLLYDTALRLLPAVRPLYWAVRLVTSHVVFLTWSYPLWRRVFATRRLAPSA